jgi:tetratricopeptide (TPR) repeat protein
MRWGVARGQRRGSGCRVGGKQTVIGPRASQSVASRLLYTPFAKYAVGYYNRGRAKKAKGDKEGGIADYNRAIELDPKLSGLLQSDATLLRR